MTDRADLSGIAALGEPVRRRLYDAVADADDAISRKHAGELAGVPTHTAKFHLDKLVDDGLLEVEFRKLTGRTGPGSGRPSKLYRRSTREIAVSLPERSYDLLSRILANAVVESTTHDRPVLEAAARIAHAEGASYGASAATVSETDLDRLGEALELSGYEPRLRNEVLELRNCPFHRAAQEQTVLVCTLNLEYINGVCAGMECRDLHAALDPDPSRCCVTVRAQPA